MSWRAAALRRQIVAKPPRPWVVIRFRFFGYENSPFIGSKPAGRRVRIKLWTRFCEPLRWLFVTFEGSGLGRQAPAAPNFWAAVVSWIPSSQP